MNLYFYSYGMKVKETDKTENNKGTVGKWTGNAEQREAYKNKFYVSANNNINNDNMYAAAGLYYNFGLINFRINDYKNVDNEGEFREISGITDGELSGEKFIIEGVSEEVHNLTLAEINEARGKNVTDISDVSRYDATTGLFYLKDLNKLEGLEGYDSRASTYWITSPYPTDAELLLNVSSSGSLGSVNVDGYNHDKIGLRPVVSIKSDVQITKIER